MVTDEGSSRGAAEDKGPTAEGAPSQRLPLPQPLPHPAADLSDDDIEEVRSGKPPHPGSGIGQDLDAEPAGDNYDGGRGGG